jgi:hypothetical protein
MYKKINLNKFVKLFQEVVMLYVNKREICIYLEVLVKIIFKKLYKK